MIVLYLNGQKVDMPENFNVNMTYQLTDLKKPEAKKNSYSKTISINGTPNNNKIFNNIFKGTSFITSTSFDPNKKIDFVLTSNGDAYESGYAVLDNISNSNGIITYHITLYGELGKFFYGLMYDANGDDRKLYDLKFNFEIDGEPLSEEQENKKILFEYNKDFVKKCWDVIKGQYKLVNDNDIYKFVAPIPCYHGFYEDFDSNKCLVSVNVDTFYNPIRTFGYDVDLGAEDGDPITGVHDYEYTRETIDGYIWSSNKYATTWKEWAIVEMDRGVTDFEMKHLRSHYLPYALKLKNIYDAIKNPENNGGYTIDDSNVSPVEIEYINNAYVVQPKFNWVDINSNNINTSKRPSWSITSGNSFGSSGISSLPLKIGSMTSDIIDLTEYANPNASIHILPAFSGHFDTTQAWHPGGRRWKTYSSRGVTYTTDHILYGSTFSSMQYFYVEVLDENDNVLSTSDIYVYGDYLFNRNDNKCVFLSGIDPAATWWTDYAINNKLNQYSINKILSKTGKKFKPSAMYNNVCTWDYYFSTTFSKASSDTDPNAIDINISHLNDGYVKNADNTMLGTDFKIDIKLPKQKCKVRVNSGAVSTDNYMMPAGEHPELNQHATWPSLEPDIYDYKLYNRSVYEGIYIPAQRYTVSPTAPTTYDYKTYRGNLTFPTTTANHIMHLSSSTTIYDGGFETQSERHTVDKFSLLQKSKSPYEYLISLGKMFNWKFTFSKDTNNIMIYSNKNYYTNKVDNIEDKIDRSSIKIVPRTATTKLYNLGLDVDKTYPADVWVKKNKIDYGKKQIVTKYDLDDKPKDVLADCIYKDNVPYQQMSLYFDETPKDYITPTMGNTIKITKFEGLNDKGDWRPVDIEKKKTWTYRGALYNKKVTQSAFDPIKRISFFDKDYNEVEHNGTLIFFNNTNTFRNEDNKCNYLLCDNIQAEQTLNENKCYYYLLDPTKEAYTDPINDIKSIDWVVYNQIPIFSKYFIKNNVAYYGSLKGEREYGLYETSTDIYDYSWKKYINDLYNQNNKVVTVKYALKEFPDIAMRKFYTFDGAIWVINKINNYNPSNLFTECEFIQVEDINNYIT